MIKVDNGIKNSTENHIYMLVVQESTGKFIDRLVYFVSNNKEPKNIQILLIQFHLVWRAINRSDRRWPQYKWVNNTFV